MIKFKIEKLKCMSCFHNIEDALKEVDPHVKAEADVKNQQLQVTSKVSSEKLKKAIEDAGYPVSNTQEL